MTGEGTADAAIEQWSRIPHEVLEQMEPDGDFCRRHLLNPVLLQMLGEVSGRRIVDAGCGHGYFARMLTGSGALVTGVEPAQGLLTYALEKESQLRQGITYIQADLTRAVDLGPVHDAVVCNMVLCAIEDWRAAMRTCVGLLRPGGRFIFSVNHPAFEQLWTTWREHGEYRVWRYLDEYEIPGSYAWDFHRSLSDYLNELTALGCRIHRLAEPRLDPAVAEQAAATAPGIEAYTHLPNFLVVAADL
ncbi:class I SAM-dependent methyltransferase [Nocardia jiangxiensis]|uniref:Class I SAM-dependent methyltransferase n=1 Tax=Nocardia jiangxiensis TaxID=282685 RepID=A0ABW6S2S5_9NOCA|nr:class I SAM-dependent methyltransferase [Nocardia jiangxiensis]